MIFNGYRLTEDDVDKARDLADICDCEVLDDGRRAALERDESRLVAIYTLALAFAADE